MKELSEYFSTDMSKKAIVLGDGGKYIIRKYINEKLIEVEEFREHTLRIVEDKAEDWIYGK